MLSSIFTALKNPAVQKFGMGLLGLKTAKQGQNQWNEAYAGPDEDAIRDRYKRTQALITQGSNFQNYSAPHLDASTASGNTAVRDAFTTGAHGGSSMLALKNRMKFGDKGAMYQAFNKNLGNMIGHQQGLDQNVAGTMDSLDSWRRGGMAMSADGNLKMGRGLMSDFLKNAGAGAFTKKGAWDDPQGNNVFGNIIGENGLGGMLKTGAEGLLGGARDIRNIFNR